MALTPKGSQAARALLEITVEELAELADVSHMSVIRFERGEKVRESTIEKLKNALEGSRIEIDGQAYKIQLQNSGQPGARLMRDKSE